MIIDYGLVFQVQIIRNQKLNVKIRISKQWEAIVRIRYYFLLPLFVIYLKNPLHLQLYSSDLSYLIPKEKNCQMISKFIFLYYCSNIQLNIQYTYIMDSEQTWRDKIRICYEDSMLSETYNNLPNYQVKLHFRLVIIIYLVFYILMDKYECYTYEIT